MGSRSPWQLWGKRGSPLWTTGNAVHMHSNAAFCQITLTTEVVRHSGALQVGLLLLLILLLLFLFLVPCSRLNWLAIMFWVHDNITYHMVVISSWSSRCLSTDDWRIKRKIIITTLLCCIVCHRYAQPYLTFLPLGWTVWKTDCSVLRPSYAQQHAYNHQQFLETAGLGLRS